MTTYTIVFPHREGIPIAVTRPIWEFCHATDEHVTWRVSLASVLRLVRHGCTKPRLVPHASGCALEVTVKNPNLHTKGDN